MQPVMLHVLHLSGKNHHVKWKKMFEISQPQNLGQY